MKKIMRKALVTIFVLALVLSLGAVGFADETDGLSCPFVITKNGKTADSSDYTWSSADNTLTLFTSGLSVGMKSKTAASANINVLFEKDAVVTFDKLNIVGDDCAISVYSSYPVKIVLQGESKVISGKENYGMAMLAAEGVSLDGTGSLYLSAEQSENTEVSTALLSLAAFSAKEGAKISGSAEANAKKLDSVSFLAKAEDGIFGYITKDGDLCKTLLIEVSENASEGHGSDITKPDDDPQHNTEDPGNEHGENPGTDPVDDPNSGSTDDNKDLAAVLHDVFSHLQSWFMELHPVARIAFIVAIVIVIIIIVDLIVSASKKKKK